jgi:hypothetical protein
MQGTHGRSIAAREGTLGEPSARRRPPQARPQCTCVPPVLLDWPSWRPRGSGRTTRVSHLAVCESAWRRFHESLGHSTWEPFCPSMNWRLGHALCHVV